MGRLAWSAGAVESTSGGGVVPIRRGGRGNWGSDKEVRAMLKTVGLAIGVGLITRGISLSSSSLAEEKEPETAIAECTYRGVTYKADALECWDDGYWHRCDGNTGRWINMRQKYKLI
jgi:hypothetical protein